jgi:methionine synthase II (cobalamin-independent)
MRRTTSGEICRRVFLFKEYIFLFNYIFLHFISLMSFENAHPRTSVPFRFDHVGSFLRPQALKEAREKFAKGEISRGDLTKVEEEEIQKLVAKEKEVGLKAVTDGEFRRSYWHLDFFWGFEGIKHVVLEHGYIFHGEESRADSALLSGKVKFTNQHPFLSHYKFLKQIAGDDVVAKQCIPAPAQLYCELVRDENHIKEIAKNYSNHEELHKDISKAYHEIILAFYDLGCRNIQLDDCSWGGLVDVNFSKKVTDTGLDPKVRQETYLKLNNEAIADLPADLIITTHVCRGNFHSTYFASGGYQPVAETYFGREKVSGFFLEYETDRAGDFSPLVHVPSPTPVVLGLFSSKFPELENKETILDRLKEATKYLSIERICLSAQCGFASTEEGNILTEEQQWTKLRFIKQIADEIWKQILTICFENFEMLVF